jgi:hypothetical protein
VLALALAPGAFLVAAKAHGRQLRLERELAGYAEVSFRARNPPWVEALWRRERRRFWAVGAILAAASIPLHRPSVTDAIVVHAALPFTCAFVVTGLLSVARTPRSRGIATVGWWALTLGLCVALLLLR